MKIGVANAQSALDWVVQQQLNGGLSSILSNLVVMGCSAGSIGAQLWSDSTLKALKWNKVLIFNTPFSSFFDSYIRLLLFLIVMQESSLMDHKVL